MTHALVRSIRLTVAAAAIVLASAVAAAALPSATVASIGSQPVIDGSIAAVAVAAVAAAAPTSAKIALVKVASGLSQPVFVTSAKDGTGRLFIVEKTGRIRIYRGGSVLATPFLDLSAAVSTGGEQGLLGLAFHPAYRTNRKFYVDYTNLAGDTVIREFRVSATNPNRVQAGSGRTLLTIHQPYANHNGGMIAFGPDGYLYIGMGDGGCGGDPGNRAQSTVHAPGQDAPDQRQRLDFGAANYRIPSSNPYVGRAGLDEIWHARPAQPLAMVVRSRDREPVDRRRRPEPLRGGRPGGRTSTGAGKGVNWGWRVMEGFHCYNPATGCNRTGKRLPLLEYSHASNGRCSITGGYVYRGAAIPALVGWVRLRGLLLRARSSS